MRNILLLTIVALLPASTAMAEPTGIPKAQKPAAADRLLPTRKPAAANSCAAYGSGFVKVAGSDSCVKIGGGIGIEAGGSR
ncbi:MAG TPA: hypothetical protein VGD13_01815 [Xanthobacteraceae bacterium]|jgi:hypothetical protein